MERCGSTPLTSTSSLIEPRSFEATHMGRRITWVLLAVLFTLVASSWADWEMQALRVRHTSTELTTEFPHGMPEISAQRIVSTRYPRYTAYSPQECEKWSHLTTPSYAWRGGPCILGIVETGTTWWGFESAVSFGLLFGSDDRLEGLQVNPVYTFL